MAGITAPRKISSATERWFPASIAPPRGGTCSSPSTFGRHARRMAGATVYWPIV